MSTLTVSEAKAKFGRLADRALRAGKPVLAQNRSEECFTFYHGQTGGAKRIERRDMATMPLSFYLKRSPSDHAFDH